MGLKVKNILTGVVAAGLIASLSGCSAETPFEDEGTGTIYLRTMISNVTTRAIEGYTDEQLADNCVVRISRCNGITTGSDTERDGLVYRKQGLKNVDQQIILKPGRYVAEAWTGDSLPASYDKKFFKAINSFEVEINSIKNIDLPCKIQNVVVSINPESTAFAYMEDDYIITIHNGDHDLQLNKTNAKGYFMIPDVANEEESLSYTIKFKKKGSADELTKEGTIADVKRAHEYSISLTYSPTSAQYGGTSFTIDIKEDEVSEANTAETPLISTDPTITGAGFDIMNPLNFTDINEIPEDLGVVICAVGNGFKEIKLTANETEYDLNESSTTLPEGIEWINDGYSATTNVTTAYLIFKKTYMTTLSGKNEFEILVRDGSDQITRKILTINR